MPGKQHAGQRATLPPWSVGERRFLFGVVVAGLFLRLLHWHSMANYPGFDFLGLDSKYYDDWAQRILREGLQGRDPYFMGPLYPHLLAIVYAIFGRSLDAVRWMQVAMSTGTIGLVHLLARRYGGARLACVASGATAIYGPIISYSVSIIYPTVNVLLTTLELLVLFEAARRRSHRLAFAAGAAIGLDALGRGNVLLFAPPALLWLAGAWGKPLAFGRPAWRGSLGIALVFGGGIAAAIAPATLHNARTGDPALLTTNGGLNFYIGNGPMASGGHETPVLFLKRADGTTEKVVADLQKDVECRAEAERATGRTLTYSEVSDFWFAETVTFAREHPGTFLSRLVRKAVHFWSAYEVPQIEHFQYFRRYSAALRGPVLTFGVLGALAIVGLVSLWRRRAAWALPYFFVASYSLSTILFFVLDRYRLPIVPALTLFAAGALLSAWDALRARHLRPAAGYAGGIAATMLLMHANVYGVDESKGIAQVLYREGIVADSRGAWEEAIRHYEEALALKPEYDKAHLNLGVDQARLGRREEALEHLHRAEELNPSYYRAPFDRGLVLEELGRLPEALDAYRHAVELEPRYLLARSALAEMLLLAGRRDEARAEIAAILSYSGRWEGEQNPSARARARRLLAYLEERDRLTRAGRGSCFDRESTFRLAELARLRGLDDDALKNLKTYFEQGGDCAEAYRALGEILLRKGEIPGAEDAFQRALHADRALPSVRLGLARLAAARGDAEGAVRALQQEIDLDPAAPAPYLEMGLVRERLLGDAAGAAVWFTRYRERGGSEEILTARRSGRGVARETGGT